MKHNVLKTETGYSCTVCQWKWKSKPTSDCPGVIRYDWGTAPANLKTAGQMKKDKLKPNGPAHGIVVINRNDWCSLYDINEAIPFTPEELAAERERKRLARYITCPHCMKDVRREKFDFDYKACAKCLPEVIRQINEWEQMREQEYEAQLDRMLTHDKDESIEWARKILADSSALILDTETTGLNESAVIVQITVTTLAGEALLNTLVDPGCPIPADATNIHGITDEMVKGAPVWRDVYQQLNTIVDGKTVLIYNAAFDTRMIWQSGEKYGVMPEFQAHLIECAMEQYAAFYGEWSEYHGSYRWQRLSGGDHSALGDCIATLELIKRMAAAKLSTEEIPDETVSQTL